MGGIEQRLPLKGKARRLRRLSGRLQHMKRIKSTYKNLFVFFGGWKLFESGDPILIEIGVALVLSFFVFVFGEIVTGLEKRVKSLEERLNEFEKKE